MRTDVVVLVGVVLAAPAARAGDPKAAPLGRSKAAAIEVCESFGERLYLRQLRCASGKAPAFKRTGNVGSRNPMPPGRSLEESILSGSRPTPPGGPDVHTIDEYAVSCGAKTESLFLDMYHCDGDKAPSQAPGGYGWGDIDSDDQAAVTDWALEKKSRLEFAVSERARAKDYPGLEQKSAELAMLSLKLFGAESAEALSALDTMVFALGKLKEYPRAQKLAEGGAAAAAKALGDEHVITGQLESTLGWLHLEQKRTAEAEKHLSRGWGILLKSKSASPDGLADVAADLVEARTRAGDKKGAQKCVKELVERVGAAEPAVKELRARVGM